MRPPFLSPTAVEKRHGPCSPQTAATMDARVTTATLPSSAHGRKRPMLLVHGFLATRRVVGAPIPKQYCRIQGPRSLLEARNLDTRPGVLVSMLELARRGPDATVARVSERPLRPPQRRASPDHRAHVPCRCGVPSEDRASRPCVRSTPMAGASSGCARRADAATRRRGSGCGEVCRGDRAVQGR